MAYELLLRLAQSTLPVVLLGSDVDTVLTYVAAGFVIAECPPPTLGRDGSIGTRVATVTAVTRSGRLAMAKRGNFRTDRAHNRRL